jgi:hypothetical protein
MKVQLFEVEYPHVESFPLSLDAAKNRDPGQWSTTLMVRDDVVILERRSRLRFATRKAFVLNHEGREDHEGAAS